MKKTLTVNLGGTVFHIDDDAYRLLDNYLNNLKLYFKKEDGGQEIVEDIEMRISELFSEKIADGQQVITICDVEDVIARMGQPQDFGANDEAEENKGKSQNEEPKQSGQYVNFGKHLYRNPDDKILGGVLGGLAAYTGWDPTLIRILALILICFYGVMIPIYFICWLIIPQANTAAEKLAMRGEPINVENIGKTVTDGFEKAANGVNDFVQSGKPRNFLQKLGDALISIAGAIIKFILILLVVVFSPILLLLIFVFVVMVIAAISVAVGGGTLLMQVPWIEVISSGFASSGMGFVGIAANIFVLAIPIFTLIYAILCNIFDWRGMNTAVKWTLVIVWFISLVLTVVSVTTYDWTIPMMYF